MARLPRIPKSSERQFATMCSNAGVLCHAASEDEMGWDFLIEFPPENYVGPAESKPAGSRAYIQIKSTTQNTPQIRLKLSNARQSSQHSEAWFVVLFHQPTHGVPRIYAVHFWKDLIYRSLKAARKADIDGHNLNRKYLTIRFEDDSDHTADLFHWMEAAISNIGPLYNMKKMEIAAKAGFEEVSGLGDIEFRVENEEVLIKNLLGLGDGIPVSKFQFTQSRFGIEDRSPLVQFDGGVAGGGIARLGPADLGECEIRFRGESARNAVTLEGRLYSTGMHHIDERFAVIRISTQFIEMLWRLHGSSQFDITFRPDKVICIREISGCAVVLQWFRRGPVDIQVWFNGNRLLAGMMNVSDPSAIGDSTFLQKISEFIVEMFGGDINVSPRALCKNYDRLVMMHGLVNNDGFSMKYTLESFDSKTVKSAVSMTDFLYSVIEGVGDRICFAIIHRPVISVARNGRRFQVELGNPTVHESYSIEYSFDSFESELEADFNSIRSKFPLETLAVHNIGVLLE